MTYRLTELNPTPWYFNPQRQIIKLLSPDTIEILLEKHNNLPIRGRALRSAASALFKNPMRVSVGNEALEKLTPEFSDFFRDEYTKHARSVMEYYFTVGIAPTKLITTTEYKYPVPSVIPHVAGVAFMVFDKYTCQHRFLWQWNETTLSPQKGKPTKDKAKFKSSKKDTIIGYIEQVIPYDPNVIFYVGCKPTWLRDNVLRYIKHRELRKTMMPSTMFTSPLANCLVEILRRDELSDLVVGVEHKKSEAPIYIETHLGTNPKDMIDIYNSEETNEETRLRFEHERTMGTKQRGVAKKTTSIIDALDPPESDDDHANARDRLRQQYQYLGPTGKAFINMNQDSIGFYNNPLKTKDGNVYVGGPAHRMVFQPLPTSVRNFEIIDPQYQDMINRAYLLPTDGKGKNHINKKSIDLQEDKEIADELIDLAGGLASHLAELIEWSIHHNKRNLALAKLFETESLEQAMSYYDSLKIRVGIAVQARVDLEVLLEVADRVPRQGVKDTVYDVVSGEIYRYVQSDERDNVSDVNVKPGPSDTKKRTIDNVESTGCTQPDGSIKGVRKKQKPTGDEDPLDDEFIEGGEELEKQTEISEQAKSNEKPEKPRKDERHKNSEKTKISENPRKTKKQENTEKTKKQEKPQKK